MVLVLVLVPPATAARGGSKNGSLPPQANEDVTQVVEMLPSASDKWNWLSRRLVDFTSSGSVLIFVTKKANCEELATNLMQEGHSLGLLHGDMDQSQRNKVIADFKKKNTPILVATDVAGERDRDDLRTALEQWWMKVIHLCW